MPPATRADAASRLRRAGCVAADDEAGELLRAAPDAETLDGWLLRRERGEPLAWIVGWQQFCGRPVRVTPGVYVPRFQSEALAARAASLLPRGGTAVDVCTGSGAVGAHLVAKDPTATVVGVDIDLLAARCARANGVPVVRADVPLPLRAGCADLVTAIAPYVPTGDLATLPADVQRYEPRHALDGGADGLAVVRRVVVAAARLLRPGGWLLVEVGGDQDRALAPTLTDAGFVRPTPWFDDEGDLRGIATAYSDRR